MKLAVVCAMEKERDLIVPLLDGASERGGVFSGRLGGNDITVTTSGIGKVNAAVTAVKLILSEHPDALISTGVAGGLGRGLSVLGVVASSEIAYHDVYCGPEGELGQVQGLPARFKADPALLTKAKAIDGVATGLFASGDQFVTGVAECDAIRAKLPDAISVDMESGALAQTCHVLGVPFISFRVISDIPGVENHFIKYSDFWENVSGRSFEVTKKFLESI